MEMSRIEKMKKKDIYHFVWIFAVLPPLVTILFSYILGVWSWGLMDDLQILTLSGSMLDKAWEYFQGFISFGEFKPVWTLHCGIFYTVFQNSPKLFYIFKWFEICLILLIWGMAAWRLTRNKTAIVLLPAITLSFHYFYDAFFYLSSHEYLGTFFLGISIHFFLNHLKPLWDEAGDLNTKGSQQMKLRWGWLFLGIIFLFASFYCKETFVSAGIALGLSYLYLAWKQKKKRKILGAIGIVLILITIAHAASLLLFIRSSYTSEYGFQNISRIMSNLSAWFKKDFMNHLPWILGSMLIFYLGSKEKVRKVSKIFSDRTKWGIFLGGLFYIGFLMILLPWNTVAYYAMPLGLFFAFMLTVLISDALSGLSFRWQLVGVVCALLLNQFVCQYALNRESVYQYDTHNLMVWFRENTDSSNENVILCNAMEAAFAIPGHVNRTWGLDIKGFQWSTNPDDMIEGKKAKFYLYSPRFSGVDISKLKDWKVIFLSKNWILYARPEKKGKR